MQKTSDFGLTLCCVFGFPAMARTRLSSKNDVKVIDPYLMMFFLHSKGKAPTESASSKEVKTILFWTKWYGLDDGFNFFGMGSEKFQKCPISNCQTTNNRSLLNESHAILFHPQAFDFKSDDLPKNRFPHQRFVMFFFEPFIHSDRATFENIPDYFFNWTFTYRRISDVASNSYGDYRFKPQSLERKIEYYGKEESLNDFYGINITRKSTMAAWFSSNCRTSVRREKLVAELQKFIRVDVFGECGQFKCAPKVNHESEDCDYLLKNDYLFYFSFENSFCPDYVTEKLFRPLRAGSVPVVFGGAHYSQFAPPHSFINALDFESAEQLANYLKFLEQNRKLYSHYFEWRRHFEIIKSPIDDWCKLCEMLNDDSMPQKTYSNIARWWFDDYPCQSFKWKKH